MLTSRQKSILFYILASPFFLAIPITIINILFLPNPVSKYIIKEIKKEVPNKVNSKIKFHDLNNDGKDERVISYHNNAKGEASLKILTSNDINYEAWSFHGYFQKSSNNFFCADINNDGFSEVTVFYYHNDSVFLSILQPYPDKEILVKNKFITRIQKRDGEIDFVSGNFNLADLNGDGNNEIVFFIGAGYSRQPRGLYAYNYVVDTILKSDSYGAFFSNMKIMDMDGDSIPEIYCGSSTPSNIPDTIGILYDDYNSWFFGFNNKLELLFSPIKNTSAPSSTQISKFVSDEKEHYLVVSFIMVEDRKHIIKFFNGSLEEVSEYEVVNPSMAKSSIITMNRNVDIDGKNYLVLGITNDEFLLLNEKLEVLKKSVFNNGGYDLFEGDLNKDGKKEHVFLNPDLDIIIYDANLENPSTISTNIRPNTYFWLDYGIKHNGNETDEMYLKTDSYLYLYTYKRDYFYYLKYPLWLLIYIVVVIILWATQKLQKIQVQRKQKIEDTINSFQIKTIKSQMDPHFMFNVLNGLAHNVAKGNNDEAYDQILRFSGLLRSLMQRVERIDISLSDEIDFVRSYLELEKFRFKDDFEFNIIIEKEVNLTQRIPRMLIQLLIENSIKHGLRNKEGLKILKVDISFKEGKTIIVVEDNGVGRKQAMKTTRDTGKGLKLITDMIRLNKNLIGKEIFVDSTDLYDEKGNSTGTRVDVVV